jgi:hypothetical protein
LEEEEEDLYAWASMDTAAFPGPTRRHTPVRIRTKSVRYSRVPPGIDLDGEGAIEFGHPVLVVPPPALAPLSYSVSTVMPLPKNELELGVNDVAIAKGDGDEYEYGEWLPGIQLGTQ